MENNFNNQVLAKYFDNKYSIVIISIVLLIYMLLLLIARIRVAVNRSQMKVTCSALNSFFQDAIQVLIIFFTKMGGYAFIFHRVLGRTTSCMESYVFIKVWAWGKVIIMH